YIYRMRELPSFLQTHNQEKLEGWLNS
ncbi:glutathione S-transferase, partial [Salmonella enterica subsp. enterica serovar Agama]|nr:glutathione S-transferase [Salmonella enterica subsp. enterica serovar Agama]